MKTKFQFYRLDRPNCALWINFIWGQGWYTGHIIPLVKHGRGYIQQSSSIWFCTSWLSETNAKCTWGCASRGILSVRCSGELAEGPGTILKYRSNLRLYPVKFSNKLYILIFIILSISPSFFDPTPLILKTFWALPATQKIFWPSILPSKVFMNTSLGQVK